VFPYALAVGLSFILPVKVALHVTVMLAVVSFPLGMILCLRALRRPLWLGLLAVPLGYHRAFFWGFINFCLGMGLAFVILALLIGPWSRRSGWWVMALCVVSDATHVYGLLVVFAYATSSQSEMMHFEIERGRLFFENDKENDDEGFFLT